MRQLIFTIAVLFVAQAQAGYEWSPYLDGGEIVPPLQYLWHVHVKPAGINVNFSGILIDQEWVLTCAACINKADTHTLFFGARNLDLGLAEPGLVTMSVSKENVQIYPDYDPAHFNERNIALVRLPSAITFSPYIAPIRLTDGASTYDGLLARVTGFGFEDTNTTTGTQLLRQADLQINADMDCRNLQEGQMCASVIDGLGPCRDEGSALFVTESDGKASVVGVFSYGYGEGHCPGQKTLFTRVATYLDWITETISGGTGTEDPITTPADFSAENWEEEEEDEEWE